MKTSTFTFVCTAAILRTGVKGFSPSVIRPLSSSKAASVNLDSLRQHSPYDHKLHAWSPFQQKPTPPPIETPVVSSNLEPGPLDTKNAVAFATWVSLIIYSFIFAPGSLDSSADSEMLNTLIAQPFPRPENINPIWFTVWNCFVPVPVAIAALTAPNGKGQRLPAAPFLLGSAFLGYFSLGPYFFTRTARSEAVRKEDLGWVSRNLFENRLFGIGLTALSLSIPVTSGLMAPDFDLATSAAEFVDLFTGSKFVTVASLDITIMSLLAAVLVGEDSKRRGWEDKSLLLTAGSILLPVVGPSLYLATRPSLEE